jgi:hypothetical protein
MIERPFFGAGARHANHKHYAVSFRWFFIPGPGAARSPESMSPALVNMNSGRVAARRPEVTG